MFDLDKVLSFFGGTIIAVFLKDWLVNGLIWKLKDFAKYRLSTVSQASSEEMDKAFKGFLRDCENTDSLIEKYLMVLSYIINVKDIGSIPQIPKKQ